MYDIGQSGAIFLNGQGINMPAVLKPKLQAVVRAVAPYVISNSQRTGVPAQWIYSIIWAETGFLGPIGGATAVSPKGAVGRMQLMPLFWEGRSKEEMMIDATNIRIGTDVLASIRKTNKDLIATASVYNCGPGKDGFPKTSDNPWGICGEGGGKYLQNIAEAANAIGTGVSSNRSVPDSGPGKAFKVAAGIGIIYLVGRALWRG